MFWYAGELKYSSTLELAIDEPGLLYGATVFTTLRIYNQSLASTLTNWNSHCQRLQSSLEIFGWQQPDWQRLNLGVEALSNSYRVLRITLFPDGRELITGRYLPSDLAERQKNGITACLVDASQYRRWLPEHKTGNYLSAWLALQASRQQGASEAILVDEQGNWLETSTGNLWGWQQGIWWTPPVEVGILAGVVREKLITWLGQQGIVVRQEPFENKLVRQFEVVAYTNSVIEVIPIHTVLQSSQPLIYQPLHLKLEQLRSFWGQGN